MTENLDEYLGNQITIISTPEEYESTNIRIGQVVKINMPSKIADIIMTKEAVEESEIKTV